MPSRTYNELKALILPFCNTSDYVKFRSDYVKSKTEDEGTPGAEIATMTFCSDQNRYAVAISFTIYLDGTYRVGQSTCIPTQGSREILKAYARANIFLTKLDLEPKV